MGKLLDKFGPQSQGIVPSGKERQAGEPKTVTAMMVNSNKLLERAEVAEAEVARLQEQLAAAKAQGGALDVPVNMLVEVEGRRRKLTPEAYVELKENLRQHELITPITVRVLDDGRYEIVSGHNRVAVYQELGRETIKAWPADADVSKTDELAFYANLLHPDLSAYEKYLGLRKIRESNPELQTAAALAARVGMSEHQVGRLLRFDTLPEDAKTLIASNPTSLGADAISQLAALTEQGRGEQVVSAVKAVIEQGIDQAKAVALAKAEEKRPAPKAAKPWTVKRSDNTKYCSVRAADNVLRIEFDSAEEAAEIQEVLREIFAKRAKGK